MRTFYRSIQFSREDGYKSNQHEAPHSVRESVTEVSTLVGVVWFCDEVEEEERYRGEESEGEGWVQQREAVNEVGVERTIEV